MVEIFNRQGSEKEVKEFRELIKSVDKNGDENISLNEFIEMMEQFVKK